MRSRDYGRLRGWPRLVMLAAYVAFATCLVWVPSVRAQALACQVAYTVSEWSGGFTANVSITNNGAARTSWSLTWNFGGNQVITNAWNANTTQSGTQVTATNMSYNGNLPSCG